jgi:hypothetical protein
MTRTTPTSAKSKVKPRTPKPKPRLSASSELTISSSSKSATNKSNTPSKSKKAIASYATTDDGEEAGGEEGLGLDKKLVLRILLAKLEGSKSCDWHELSLALAGQAGGDTTFGVKGGAGKGRGKKATEEKAKEAKAISGTQLHDLYHNVSFTHNETRAAG